MWIRREHGEWSVLDLTATELPGYFDLREVEIGVRGTAFIGSMSCLTEHVDIADVANAPGKRRADDVRRRLFAQSHIRNVGSAVFWSFPQ